MQLLTKTAAPDHLRVNFEHFLMEMAIPRNVFFNFCAGFAGSSGTVLHSQPLFKVIAQDS